MLLTTASVTSNHTNPGNGHFSRKRLVASLVLLLVLSITGVVVVLEWGIVVTSFQPNAPMSWQLTSSLSTNASAELENVSTAYPTWFVSEQVKSQRCRMEGLKKLREMQSVWQQRNMPQLTTVILTPPDRQKQEAHGERIHYYYHVFMNLVSMTVDQEHHLRNATLSHWYCDEARAELLGRWGGDPTGTIFIIRCPTAYESRKAAMEFPVRNVFLKLLEEMPENEQFFHRSSAGVAEDDSTGGKTESSYVDIMSYDVLFISKCAAETDLKEIEAAADSLRDLVTPPRVMSCVMVFGASYFADLEQYIAYHRLIGTEHFFVYIGEAWNEGTMASTLPSAPYITYRFFEVKEGLTGEELRKGRAGKTPFKTYYQADIFNECLYRSRGWGTDGETAFFDNENTVAWTAMLDVDEYIRLPESHRPDRSSKATGQDRDKNADAIGKTLQSHLRQYEEEMISTSKSGIILSNVYYGSDGYEFPGGVGVGRNPSKSLSLDFVWRAKWPMDWFNVKVIVDAWNVQYHFIHMVSDGAPFDKFKAKKPETDIYWIFDKRVVKIRRAMHVEVDANSGFFLAHYRRNYKWDGFPEEEPMLLDTSTRDRYRNGTVDIMLRDFLYGRSDDANGGRPT